MTGRHNAAESDAGEQLASGGHAGETLAEQFLRPPTRLSVRDCGERALRVSDSYRPFPRQEEFHRSGAKYRLFGGAAGPGKSKALLWEAILQALRYPGVDTLLLRRTFPELEQSLISQFRRDVPHGLYANYNDTKHCATFHNGSTLRFGYCLSENDVYQYQGAEYLFIGVDELTLFTLKQWQFLTSRNRCPVPGTFPNMAGASNPGNIGHAWVKAMWLERKSAPGMERPEEYDPSDFAFIRATLKDNPIYANDPNYLKTLDALPRLLRQAFLVGDWNLFAGQYFDLFDLGRHTAPAADLAGALEHWWPRWISIDWGFHHPAAVYWHAAAPDGRTFTYRELVQAQLSPRMLAQGIVERTAGERIAEIWLSPDAFAQRTAESSIAEQMGDVLAAAGLPRPAPADDDRVGGWMLLYQLLEADEWVISDACRALIACLPALTRDDDRPEDVLKSEGDDPADAARYGLKSRLAPGRPPLEQRIAHRLSSLHLSDPTAQHIAALRLREEERRRGQPVRLPGRFRPPPWRGPQ